MMQLIVLGQIPGTHFQITFIWFQLLMLLAFGYVGYRFNRLRNQKTRTTLRRQFEVISLRALDQA